MSARASLSSRPLSSGMITSDSTSFGGSPPKEKMSSAWRPFSASMTTRPAPSSVRRTSSRIAGSSSTTSTSADSMSMRVSLGMSRSGTLTVSTSSGAAGR